MAAEAPEPLGTGSARGRREQIRQRVIAEGFVHIDTLARAFDVSTMTIHRDLQQLESQGWLRKVRGGATSRPSTLFHGDVLHRSATMAAAKREITEAAGALLSPGKSVILDESTTVLHLLGKLPTYAPLTVITNSLTVITTVAREQGIDLIGLGGSFFPAYDAFLGMQTVDAIAALRADLLFMSTTAVTNDRCFHQSQETVQVKRAFMAAAAYKVLLVDHTKFTKVGLHELAPLTDFDLVVVDSQTSEDTVTQLRRLPVEVLVAAPLPADQPPEQATAGPPAGPGTAHLARQLLPG